MAHRIAGTDGVNQRGLCLVAATLSVILSVQSGLAQGGVPTPSGPAIAVPSGSAVHWMETIRDTKGPSGLTLRFRFVAPAVEQGGLSPDQIETDMQALCTDYAIPRASTSGGAPKQIVVSLSAQPVAFGVADDSVPQYFDAFSIQDGACVWDMF